MKDGRGQDFPPPPQLLIIGGMKDGRGQDFPHPSPPPNPAHSHIACLGGVIDECGQKKRRRKNNNT